MVYLAKLNVSQEPRRIIACARPCPSLEADTFPQAFPALRRR